MRAPPASQQPAVRRQQASPALVGLHRLTRPSPNSLLRRQLDCGDPASSCLLLRRASSCLLHLDRSPPKRAALVSLLSSGPPLPPTHPPARAKPVSGSAAAAAAATPTAAAAAAACFCSCRRPRHPAPTTHELQQHNSALYLDARHLLACSPAPGQSISPSAAFLTLLHPLRRLRVPSSLALSSPTHITTSALLRPSSPLTLFHPSPPPPPLIPGWTPEASGHDQDHDHSTHVSLFCITRLRLGGVSFRPNPRTSRPPKHER